MVRWVRVGAFVCWCHPNSYYLLPLTVQERRTFELATQHARKARAAPSSVPCSSKNGLKLHSLQSHSLLALLITFNGKGTVVSSAKHRNHTQKQDFPKAFSPELCTGEIAAADRLIKLLFCNFEDWRKKKERKSGTMGGSLKKEEAEEAYAVWRDIAAGQKTKALTMEMLQVSSSHLNHLRKQTAHTNLHLETRLCRHTGQTEQRKVSSI